MKILRIQKGSEYNYSQMASELNEINGFNIYKPVFAAELPEGKDIIEFAKYLRGNLYCADIEGAEYYDTILIGETDEVFEDYDENDYMVSFSNLEFFATIDPIF